MSYDEPMHTSREFITYIIIALITGIFLGAGFL